MTPALGVSARPAPAFDTGAGDDGPSTDDLIDDDAPPAGAPDDMDDDDLSIGEVSRVVRLADIASKVPARRPAARNATAAAAAIARGTGAVTSMDPSGPMVPVPADGSPVPPNPPDEAAASSIYASIVAPPPRRRTALYGGIAAVVVMIAAVVAVVASSGGSDEDDGGVAARKYDDLGYSTDDPLRPRAGTNAGTAPEKGTAAATGRRPGGGGTRPNPQNGTNPASGTAAATAEVPSVIGPDGMPLKPLTPDDVFAMSRKMEIGTRRCYERALKDDPFLKVSKIKATVTVARAGNVSNVVLSSMQGTPLATCLAAAIGRWRFRPSTEGIVSEFSIVFEQR